MSTYPANPWDRLREERERLGMTQTEFAAHGGVKKLAQINYEKGTRKPAAEYWLGIAKAGADVAYIVSGQRAALSDALQNIRAATEAAAMIAGKHESLNEIQEQVFHVLQARKKDEVQLLTDYRRCAPPDQKTIRQMAARLAADAVATAGPDLVIGDTAIEAKASAAHHANERPRPRKTPKKKGNLR